ncbi:MAG TPA: S8 family serine peptidase [Acidimicrobiales bacterium]|nr:S8 family serine peptidase [Acidimicrobiales bacterium]
MTDMHMQPESGSEGEAPLSSQTVQYTGRYIVVFADEVSGDSDAMTEALGSVAGVNSVANSMDYEAGAVDADDSLGADATVFAELGVAVVDSDPTQTGAMEAAVASDSRILAVEPERILYAIDDSGNISPSMDYVRGFRDATVALYEGLSGEDASKADAEALAEAAFSDSAQFTWGLVATKASTSTRHGKGIRVAVLDTGFDLKHPDFGGRKVTSKSFITGQEVQDAHGHGTHCVGTSCGPLSPQGSRRYGVATGADIFVGKVLSNEGSGSDSGILAGINWAVANKCQIISMSLGADIRQVSRAYERVGRRAMAAGCLVIAAAGNNANRSGGNPGFVGVPANSPSILAVAAVDSRMRIANFSARSNPVGGGKVDIAGPGVAVYSSWPMPKRYHTISGTSMATPHVAGLAALWAQSTGKTGTALWSAVLGATRQLALPDADVGAGLAQAP